MTTDTNPTTHNPVDEVLNETEIGAFIASNKTLFISLVVAALLGVAGYGLFNYMNGQKMEEYGSKVYSFTSTTLKDYQTGKVDKTALVNSFNTLNSEISGFKGLVPAAISVSDSLVQSKELDSALSVLESVEAKSEFAKFFVGIRKASIQEDLGQNDKAISTLEELRASELKLLSGKLNLDLGRLYIKKGDKVNAKSRLEDVVNNMAQAEFVKLAKLYLAEL